MDLERLSVRLRPRNGWESADLGLALGRTWRRPIYAAWLTLTVPLALLLVSWLGGRGLLLFWWLLPLNESLVLFTLSRAVFGSVPTWRETLYAAPSLWRKAAGELWIRRLLPTRVLFLPVTQLEGLRGQKRRQRVAVLNAGNDVASMLALTFVILEFCLWAAGIAFIVIMTPSWLGIDWDLVSDQFFSGSLSWGFRTTIWMLAAAVILILHPLYVSAGFALYLNRRTALEGWDLEIAFRRLARRLDRSSQPSEQAEPKEAPETKSETPQTSGAQVLMIGLAAALALSSPGQAQVPEETSQTPAVESEAVEFVEMPRPPAPSAVWEGDPDRDPRQLIAAIMERPELQYKEKVTRWRLRSDLFDDQARDSNRISLSWLNPVLAIIAEIMRLVAAFSEPLLWLVVTIAVVLLLRAAWKRLPAGAVADHGRTHTAPESLFGLDLRPETLPDDIPGEAETLWQAGRHTAALSLLYRGALGQLAVGGLELRESFTEDDCLRASASQLESARFDFFTELTRAWQKVAYAHRTPETSAAQQLWSTWNEHFGTAVAPGDSA